jgi:hypothetical protein
MRTSTRALVAGGSVAALALGYGAIAAPSHGSAADRHRHSAPHATFGTPVVVDFFRPGYEPDLAIAKAGKYKGSTYVSVPNGFSTTMSYLWRSDDGRHSFHLTEGNALGKEATCVGGGDTELQLDPVNGDVYFNDLQGLTNFTNSRSTDGGHTWDTSCTSVNGAGVDRQWIGIDSNGGKSAVGAGAKAGRLYFDYDNVNQDTNGIGGNQLVMNESVDGVHYGNKCEAAEVPCALPPAVITRDEGIPGNVVVDNVRHSRYQHRVYAIHTSNSQSAVIMSWCSGKKGDHTAAQVANDCTDPTQIVPTDKGHLNVNWHDSYVRAPGNWQTGHLFPSVAIDSKGTLYAVWSEYPGASDPTGPGSIKLAISRDGAKHWSKPITVSPTSLKNDVMPWVVAGSAGRIGIAWYGSTTAYKKDAQGVHYGPDPVDNALWNLYYSTSVNALSKHPTFGLTKVSDHPVKYGDISTGGLGGSQDRSLGDFFQVQMGLRGEAVITYVDDTSADRNQDTCGGCGETPAEAAGPVMVVTQNGGPSLLAGKSIRRTPKLFGHVQGKPAPAFLAAASQDVKAPKTLQVVGASIRKKTASSVTVTLTTADKHLASDLRTTPVGGAVNTWLVRWAAPSYKKPGDGNQFYVAMQSVAGSTPTFYTGTTQAITTTHAKYFTYPAQHAISGVVQGATITWTLPLKLVGSPKKGQGMFSVTGFTSTQAAPAATSTVSIPNQGGELGDVNIPNLISALRPFTYIVGK